MDGGLTRPEILHVDDNEDFLEIFQLNFYPWFEITQARTIDEALNLLEQKKFDAVLTDFDMREVSRDGMHLLTVLKLEYPDTPVIFLTGQGNEEVAREAFIHGATDYFSKDFSIVSFKEKLMASIRTQLEKRNALKALQDSEKRFRTYIEKSTDTITVFDGQGRITYVSPSINNMGGYTTDEILNSSVFDYILPDDHAEIQELFEKILRIPAEPICASLRLKHKDGSIVYLETTARNLINDPVVRGIVSNSRNITDRVRMQNRILHLNKVLTSIRDIDRLIIQETDPHNLISKVCSCLVENRGYRTACIILLDNHLNIIDSAEIGIGQGFQQMLISLHIGGLPEWFTRTLDSAEINLVQGTCCGQMDLCSSQDNDGMIKMMTRLHYGDTLFGILCAQLPEETVPDNQEQELFQDIAGSISYALHTLVIEEERKKMCDEIRQREVLLQSVNEISPIGFYVADGRTGKVLHYNRQFLEIWGLSHLEEKIVKGDIPFDEIVKHWINLSKDQEWSDAVRMLSADDNYLDIIEKNIELTDGRVIRLFTAPILDHENKYLGRLFNFSDITIPYLANKNLQQENQDIRRFLEAIPEVFFLGNPDYKIKMLKDDCKEISDFPDESRQEAYQSNSRVPLP